jgi:hypothetical protein
MIMENNQTDMPASPDLDIQKHTQYAAVLRDSGYSKNEIMGKLEEKGLSPEDAENILTRIGSTAIQFNSNPMNPDRITSYPGTVPRDNSRASRDMLFGALWCIGGTVLTLANTGYIFWGAIVFGGVQFIRGLINYVGSDRSSEY